MESTVSTKTTTFPYEELPEFADVMVVFAHPDDEVATFGGVIPALIAAGRSVVCLCMTSGADGGDEAVRELELRSSLWTCGLRSEPLFAGFEDCGYVAPGQFETIDWVWERWGSRENAARIMYHHFLRFQPTTVFMHNPYTGDYGHPNHMASGWACLDACELCTTSDLEHMKTGALSNLYMSSKAEDAKEMEVDEPLSLFDGATAHEIAASALTCHQSQGASRSALRTGHRFEKIFSSGVKVELGN